MTAKHRAEVARYAGRLAALTGGFRLSDEQLLPLVEALCTYPVLELARACVDEMLRTRTSLPVPADIHAWLAARRERATPREDCGQCGGTGWAYVDSAAVRRCGCIGVRSSAPAGVV